MISELILKELRRLEELATELTGIETSASYVHIGTLMNQVSVSVMFGPTLKYISVGADADDFPAAFKAAEIAIREHASKLPTETKIKDILGIE